MDFNPLRQSLQAVAAWFVRIFPYRAPLVQAVLVHPHVAAFGIQKGLHHPRPARLKGQPLAGQRNDAALRSLNLISTICSNLLRLVTLR